jgi:quercetin dioxygenase-like cupin family protein
VLDKVATALQVPIEELTSAPRASGRLYPKAALRIRRQGDGAVRQLLPDPIPGVVIERMEIPPGGRIPGVPHMPGTREYFTCESGEVVLAVGGTPWTVGPGDVLAFRGDQRHSYRNVERGVATRVLLAWLGKMLTRRFGLDSERPALKKAASALQREQHR